MEHIKKQRDLELKYRRKSFIHWLFTDKIKETLTILCFFIFVLVVGIILFSSMKVSFDCNVGENNIAGDYKVIPETFYNQRYCAIKDCVAFNEYQEAIGGKEICVV